MSLPITVRALLEPLNGLLHAKGPRDPGSVTFPTWSILACKAIERDEGRSRVAHWRVTQVTARF